MAVLARVEMVGDSRNAYGVSGMIGPETVGRGSQADLDLLSSWKKGGSVEVGVLCA